MATAKKVPVDDFQVEMVMSKDEAAFLRTVLGSCFCSNSDNKLKWNKIREGLYQTFRSVIPDVNNSIQIYCSAVMCVDN